MSKTRWVVVEDPNGQPSPMYRGLVCLVSMSPSISVVTEDGTTVDSSTWPDVARLIASAPELKARAESAESALAAAREENEWLRGTVENLHKERNEREEGLRLKDRTCEMLRDEIDRLRSRADDAGRVERVRGFVRVLCEEFDMSLHDPSAHRIAMELDASIEGGKR